MLDPDAALVQAAKAIIERRYRDTLTLEALAKDLAVSPYHLHRTFKRLMGTTPADYLFGKRIQAAKEALRNEPSRSVTYIALEVGFQSLSHFSTVFRKTTGSSPSQYRFLHLNKEGRKKAPKDVTCIQTAESDMVSSRQTH